MTFHVIRHFMSNFFMIDDLGWGIFSAFVIILREVEQHSQHRSVQAGRTFILLCLMSALRQFNIIWLVEIDLHLFRMKP